jgi:hypothetical protein
LADAVLIEDGPPRTTPYKQEVACSSQAPPTSRRSPVVRTQVDRAQRRRLFLSLTRTRVVLVFGAPRAGAKVTATVTLSFLP